uniref:NADH-ubiquinone oxidoreductase chain 4L n=1 Tax=Stenophyella macreta TaxID=2813424 RepID=A0A8T9ZWD4_9HEMI|nr:NADH dehydrogenase subunit 4L [Stenophyella macreta]
MIMFSLSLLLSGLLVFSSSRKHLLINLLSLEYLVLVLFLMMYLYMLLYSMEMYILLLFLVFSVCEGALGLGVLVNMIRSHGNDLLSSASLLSW